MSTPVRLYTPRIKPPVLPNDDLVLSSKHKMRPSEMADEHLNGNTAYRDRIQETPSRAQTEVYELRIHTAIHMH